MEFVCSYTKWSRLVVCKEKELWRWTYKTWMYISNQGYPKSLCVVRVDVKANSVLKTSVLRRHLDTRYSNISIRVLILKHKIIDYFFNTLTKVHYIFLHFIYQISRACFGVLYTILGENFLNWLKTATGLKDYYIRCVIKYKICHFCRLTMFLQWLKEIYSRNSQLIPKYINIKIKDNQQNKSTKTATIRYRLNQAINCF